MTSKAATKQIETAQKELKAVEYRRAGYSYTQIAQALGYKDHTGARSAVLRSLERAKQEPVAELRELEAHRLDTAQAAIWQDVIAGDKQAVTALMRIMERRAKLLGLDSPIRIEQEITVFEGGSEIDMEVQRLAELIAQDRATGHRGSISVHVGDATSAT